MLNPDGGGNFNALNAQEDVNVTIREISGNIIKTTSAYFPIRLRNNYYSVSQQIYTVDEILASSPDNKLPNGKISKITFYASDIVNYKTVTVYIKHIDYTYFTNSNNKPKFDTDWKDGDRVYTGVPTINDGKMELTLDNKFEYDGKSNILVYVDTDAKVINSHITSDKKFDCYGNTSYSDGSTRHYRAVYGSKSSDTGFGTGNWPSNTGNQYNNIITLTFSTATDEDEKVLPSKATDPYPLDAWSNITLNPSLEWTFGANTEEYQVLLGTEVDDNTKRVVNTKGQTKFVAKGNSDNGSYSVEGLTPSTTYCWQVISKNENGETDGDIWRFTTMESTDNPTAMVTKISPANGAIVKNKEKEIVLQWQYNNEEHTRYTVYLGESATEMEEFITGTDNIIEYTLKETLKDETTYFWRVDVNNATYTSKDTEVWNFTTKAVGNVSGTIKFKDENNNDFGIDGVTVSFYDKQENKVAETTTDNSGNYNFTDVFVGNYDIVLTKNGYETYTADVTVTKNETTSLDIYMPSVIKEDGTWNVLNAPSTKSNELIVRANAVLQSTAVVGTLTIEEGKSVTISKGGILTVVGGINNNGNLIIKDGGQLFQNNENVKATFEMGIIKPTEWSASNKTGWQFISSPFVDAAVASFVPSEGEYDLYKYNGTQELEWVNHKGGEIDVPGTDAETEFSFDFNDGSMEGLRVFQGENATGDNWQVTPDNGDFAYFAGDDDTKGIYSCSFNNGQLYPYNYVVTEQAYTITESSMLSWFIRPTDPMYGSDDKYDVVASTDGVTFDIVLFSSNGSGLTENELSLAEHAGKTLYIGFYHYTEGGQPGDALVLDNIRLSSGSRSQTRGTSSFEKTFTQGVGYLASYEKEDIATLSGNLYNKDNFTFKVSHDAEKEFSNFHLLGNPFPFNMDWSKVQATDLVDGYAVVNGNGGYEMKNDGAIPVGDGFFVKAIGENPSLYYAHNTRGSRQSANSINVIANGKAGKDNVIINFAGQSEGFNKLQNFNEDIATVFVANNGKRYGIANVDENVSEVEISFIAKQMGSYSISIKPNGEFETVTLVDRFTGIETNMLIEDEYNFTATSNDSHNRFVVKLDNRQQTTDNSQFVYQSGEDLIINAEGTIQIIDMMGRVVYSNEMNNGRINVSDFNNAAYVVRVVNEEGVKVQKVVIY